VTALAAVLIFFGCQLFAVAMAWWIVRRDMRAWGAATPADGKRLRASGFPIMSILAIQMFQDWLLFALVAGAVSAAALGALRVATQVTMIITILVTTGETFISARVAGDLRAGRPDLVWRRHFRARLAMVLTGGPLVLVSIIWPGQILGLAFGPEFIIAGPALAIMAAGQATKIVAGPIGIMLLMSGHERWLLRFTIIGLMLVVALGAWLVPIYGMIGAAVAQAASTAFRNIASYIAAWILIPRTVADIE